MTQLATGMKRTAVLALLFAAAVWFAPDAMADGADDAAPAAGTRASEAQPAVAPATDEEDVADAEVENSDAHRVKAPEIDIAGMRDPFESYLTVLARQNKNKAESQRRKRADHDPEPLESFDLGALRLVAIMQMGGKSAAMVEDPEGKGYVVRSGNYIGRDNGRVVAISGRVVEIMEDEFTAAGDIVKRKATLTLNEVNK